MNEKVAIVGAAQTKYERRKIADTFETLAYDVTVRALADAGMDIGEIDNVVTVSNDFWDGRTISSMAITDACGSYGKNISTVEGDGTFGVLYGLMRILSGHYGTTLVVAHHKGSESEMAKITNAMFDPIYLRQLGMDSVSSSALQARAYMDLRGATEEQFAAVSVKNHKNGMKNPLAQTAKDLTVEDVMASRRLAGPLKLWDCSPVSDGAAAVILAREDRVAASQKPVWLLGVGHHSDAYHFGDRALGDPWALKKAAARAYEMAGIKDPAKTIDVAEVYDAFSYMELMWLEGLGLCGDGQAGAMTESGATAVGGDLPVNPSGGCLCAHPVQVAGLARVIEAALQVRGEAGERQAAGAKTALAHGINGPCGQAHCVWVLGG